MTPDRFAALAEAYGADPARWPSAERPAAEGLLAHAAELVAVLSQAGWLDQALAGYQVTAPSADLQRRITTAMLRRRSARARIGRWLSGLGAAGVLGAGVASGAAAIALVGVSAPLRPDWEGLGSLYEQSGFGDVVVADDGPASSTGI